MDKKETIIMLLGKTNMGTTAIARTVGCDPSYVSQLKADPEVVSRIEELQAENTLDALTKSERLKVIEQKALNALEASLTRTFDMRPLEAAKVLQVIATIPGKEPPGESGKASEGIKTLVLNLPANFPGLSMQVAYNTANEIVEINGREMRSLPSSEVLKLMHEKTAELKKPSALDGLEIVI